MSCHEVDRVAESGDRLEAPTLCRCDLLRFFATSILEPQRVPSVRAPEESFFAQVNFPYAASFSQYTPEIDPPRPKPA